MIGVAEESDADTSKMTTALNIMGFMVKKRRILKKKRMTIEIKLVLWHLRYMSLEVGQMTSQEVIIEVSRFVTP